MAASLATAGGFEPQERGEARRIALAFLAALALHAGAVGLFVSWRSPPPAPPGEQEIAVDLAPQLIETPTVAVTPSARTMGTPVETVPIEAPKDAPIVPPATTAEPIPPEPPVEARTLPPVEPTPAVKPPAPAAGVLPPDAKPIESTAVEAVEVPAVQAPVEPRTETAALPPPEEVTATPPPPEPIERKPTPPKPVERKPEPAKPVERKPEPRRPPAARSAETREGAREAALPRAGSAGSSNRDAAGASSRENSSGAAAAGNPDILRRYMSQVGAVIQRRVESRYDEPRAGKRVSARIQITVLRSGQITASQILQGSGRADLDRMALAAAAPGMSMPTFPDSITKPQLTIAIPIHFDRD